MADPDGKYGKAYLALSQHEKLLTLAQAFGAARRQVDIGATVVLPPFEDAPESAAFTVEHGRAIDKAFIGKKKHVRFNEATQEFVPDKTYETFEEMNGLTRAYVNFIWESEMITDVPKRDAER